MIPDIHGSFLCALLGVFDATFPFQHRPTFVVILRKFAKDRFEIYLAVSQGAKSPSAVDPTLIATVNTLFTGWIEFSIFCMKHFNSLVIVVDIFQVVETLQNKMRRVI